MEERFKKYRSKEVVEAYEFQDGMEDGFETRYYDPSDKHEDGSFSTWGIPGQGETAEMQVPFILNENGRKVLAGNGYVIVRRSDGRVHSMKMEEFNEQFEPQ